MSRRLNGNGNTEQHITPVVEKRHTRARKQATDPTRYAFLVARCVAAGFALYATARHPYSYYILTRWIVFLTCCWGLFLLRRRLWPSFALVYAVVGLVFNPLFSLHFARNTWHNLDIAAAALLLVSLAFDYFCSDSDHICPP